VATSPPDIVLGVALAADPQKYRAAVERLQRLRAGAAAGTSFDPGAFAATVTKPAEASENPARAPASSPAQTAPSAPRQARKPADAFAQLEAFVLQTFIKSMLPKNAQHVFGKGTAGEVWKSMLAEKLGNEIAKSGQIGIADRLSSARTEAVAQRPGAPVKGPATALLSPSASVASAFLAAQTAPASVGVATGTAAARPATLAEQD
jgi:peptidoglycan hydrolase FlgJ